MSTECRREPDLVPKLARLSRVEADREMGGVLVKMLANLGGFCNSLDRSSFSARSEPIEDVFSSLSTGEGDFFFLVLDSLSGLDLEDVFLSSFRGVADHAPQDDPSLVILGRSFLE